MCWTAFPIAFPSKIFFAASRYEASKRREKPAIILSWGWALAALTTSAICGEQVSVSLTALTPRLFPTD